MPYKAAPKPFRTNRQYELFWENVDKTGEHWLWTGQTVGGYGRWGKYPAHVAAYALTTGSLPQRWQQVHHTCEVTLCVRPEHLAAITRSEHKRIHMRRR